MEQVTADDLKQYSPVPSATFGFYKRQRTLNPFWTVGTRKIVNGLNTFGAFVHQSVEKNSECSVTPDVMLDIADAFDPICDEFVQCLHGYYGAMRAVDSESGSLTHEHVEEIFMLYMKTKSGDEVQDGIELTLRWGAKLIELNPGEHQPKLQAVHNAFFAKCKEFLQQLQQVEDAGHTAEELEKHKKAKEEQMEKRRLMLNSDPAKEGLAKLLADGLFDGDAPSECKHA